MQEKNVGLLVDEISTLMHAFVRFSKSSPDVPKVEQFVQKCWSICRFKEGLIEEGAVETDVSVISDALRDGVLGKGNQRGS